MHPNIRFCVNGTGDVPIRLGQSDCEIRLGEPDETAEEDVLFASTAWNRGFFRSGANLTMGKAVDGWTPVDGPALPSGASH